MTTFNMRVADDVKENFSTIAKLEGETATHLVAEFMKRYVEEKVKENGLYALYLMKDTMTTEEAQDINNSINNMTTEEQEIAETEIITL